ncbi:MAG: hypothetical protein KBS86_03445 [Proteobacteria bacterium]|nr:hypothetical protein [Candidatus Enterousia scatequi]
MKIGKLIFGGAMASILMIGVASAAVGEASLTTKEYVDGGLRAVYSAAGTAADTKISTAIGNLGNKSGTTPYADVKDYVDTMIGNVTGGSTVDISALATRVSNAESDITTLIGTANIPGSVDNKIATAIADGGVINTAVTTGVTNMVNATTLRMQDQLGWDMSKSPNENGSFAKTVTTEKKTVVGAINELNEKVNAIDVQSGAADYITVTEGPDGTFTVGLANDVATKFSTDFNFSQN